jgi:hypothetical protein
MAKVTLIGIVRASHAAAANRAAQTIFPSSVGDNFGVSLWPTGTTDFAGTAPAAYTCGEWYLEDTQRSDMLAAFKAEGFRAREATLIGAGGTVRTADNLWLFDGAGWTYQGALDALGLVVYAGEE